jgi:DNA gyrase/topoisomerase IV subunit A
MFQEILIFLKDQEEEYQKMKNLFSNTPIEKSFDFILYQINQDLNKIMKMSDINENYL